MQGMTQRTVARRLRQGVLGTVAMCIALGGGASTAWAGAAFQTSVTVPLNVTVGETVSQRLHLTNVSFDGSGESGYVIDSYQIDDITFVPTCGSPIFSADCPNGSWDPGVIVPNPLVGTGRVGTACGGRRFTIALIDLQGKYRFTPHVPFALGPSSSTLAERRCDIDFISTVQRAPASDSDPAAPGLQTDQKAFMSATDIGPTHIGLLGSAIGTARTTIAAGATAAAINTVASPTVQLGQGTLTDTATVSGLVNPVTGAGAGTVTFVLYGPNDATCATPIFTSSNRPLVLNEPATAGTATSSPPFTPTAPGTYQWIATYTGDANNLPVAGVCGDPLEQTVVTRARSLPAVVNASTNFQLRDSLAGTPTVVL